MSIEKNISLESLSIGYGSGSKRKSILSNLNLFIRKGELLALVGSNGSGKSTLLRTISGLQAVLSGEVIIEGKRIDAWSRKEFAKIVAFVSTEWIHISNLKVRDLIALGRYPHTSWFGNLKTEDHKYVNEALEMVGMSHKAEDYFNELSDGERQRIMIARTLAQDTPIIVMDEPTAFLDLPNKYEIAHLLFRLSREKGKTILFSIHDLNIAMKEADRIWLINDRQLIEGAPEDLILNRELIKAFAVNNLEFDISSGEFFVPRKKGISIALLGSGERFDWTKKALERLEFDVDCNKSGETTVLVDDLNKQWIATINNNSVTCNSIYELSLTLKQF
jgi:iron complex transport system ATP-binding protein